MTWLETHFDLTQPGLWAFVTAALAILAANIAWLIVRACEGPRLRAVARLLRSSGARAAAWLIASLYLLLPPFYAWRYGAISPYLLGIAELDWIESLSAGAPFVGLVVALIAFGWLVYRRALPTGAPIPAGESRVLLALRAAIDASLTQWRLAFCRAALIAWLTVLPALPAPIPAALLRELQAQPFYWGSWLGLGLALLEAGLNPFFRDTLGWPAPEARRHDRPEALLRGLALAVATTGLFVLTRNFWLCLACHVVADTVIAGWLPLRRPTPQVAG
jgi:hypothetical protein